MKYQVKQEQILRKKIKITKGQCEDAYKEKKSDPKINILA